MGACTSNEPKPNPNNIDLSHFQMLQLIGKGGFGVVHSVRNISTGELFALKRMAKSNILKSQFRTWSAWNERDVPVDNIPDSPFLMTLTHAFQSDRELYLVMPLCTGGDLRTLLKTKKQFTEDETRFYAAELALALEALHERHIVYRDLKPANVLITASGHIKLCDFGLSCYLSADDNYLTYGSVGTVGYCAPEIFDQNKYGVSVDIYAYGVCIYQLLHGHRLKRKGWEQKEEEKKMKRREKKERERMMKETQKTDDEAAHKEEEEKEEEVSYDSDNDRDIHNMIEKGELYISPHLSPATHDFLHSLLSLSPSTRPSSWSTIKSHPFFTSLDWDIYSSSLSTPPYIPPSTVTSSCLTHSISLESDFLYYPKKIEDKKQRAFGSWEYDVDAKKYYEREKMMKKERVVVVVEKKKKSNDTIIATPLTVNVKTHTPLHDDDDDNNDDDSIHLSLSNIQALHVTHSPITSQKTTPTMTPSSSVNSALNELATTATTTTVTTTTTTTTATTVANNIHGKKITGQIVTTHTPLVEVQ